MIIKRQKALGLTLIDVKFFLQLLPYWWDRENLSRPSRATIATVGADLREVKHRFASMEKVKFIKRAGGVRISVCEAVY